MTGKRLCVIIFLLLLAFSLQGCFHYLYFRNVEQLDIRVMVGGDYQALRWYEAWILIDSADVTSDIVFYDDSTGRYIRINEDRTKAIVFYTSVGYCNAAFRGGDIFGCGGLLSDVHHSDENIKATVVLRNTVSGKSIVLDNLDIDIYEHRKTSILVQAYLGSDSSKYRHRNVNPLDEDRNFKWDKAKYVYFEDLKDSIAYYTEFKYSDEPRW